MLDRLVIGRAVFTLRARAGGPLPPFLGSALRGGIGHALRKIACLPLCRNVDTCILRDRCAYSVCFETPLPQGATRLRGLSRIPHPLVIEPPADHAAPWEAGEELRFGLTLVGRAIELFPYFVASVDQLASTGLGAARVPFEMVEVTAADSAGEILWPGPEQAIQPLRGQARTGATGSTPPTEVTIRFETPTRLTESGHITSAFRFRVLARSVVSRLSALLYFHCGAPLDADFRGLLERAETVEVVASALSVRKLARWSNRQQARIQLDGLVGSVTVRGESVAEWWPFLTACEPLHVGKGAVMGLGKYRVAPKESTA